MNKIAGWHLVAVGHFSTDIALQLFKLFIYSNDTI